MSNALHDSLTRRATGIGFDALRTPQAEPAPEGRESAFAVITTNAFLGGPDLVEAGLRIWIMALRACALLPPEWSRKEQRALQAVALRCNGNLAVPMSADLQTVFELLIGDTHTARETGRRASLLAYALNRGVIVREVLPSFDAIGHLWQLTAANKRSAVCQAMNKLRAELVRCGRLPSTFRFWFEKSAEARIVYEQAQIGNHNRHAAEHEHVDTLDGVPLKPAYARLTAAERHRLLNDLHQQHEARRLALL